MNAYETLQKFGEAQATTNQHRLLVEKVQHQLDEILALSSEKEALRERLDFLSADRTVEELDFSSPEILDQSKELRDLQERLEAYILIGPCGLTVQEVAESSLTVEFHPMWLSVAHTYTLTLEHSGNDLKVSSTDIPQFLDVTSIVTRHTSDVPALVDRVGRRLSAYCRRKGEVIHVTNLYPDLVYKCDYLDPVLHVQFEVHCVDASTEISKKVAVLVTFQSLDDTQPDKVKLAAENVRLPSADLKQNFFDCSFSAAVEKVVRYLQTAELLVDTEDGEG